MEGSGRGGSHSLCDRKTKDTRQAMQGDGLHLPSTKARPSDTTKTRSRPSDKIAARKTMQIHTPYLNHWVDVPMAALSRFLMMADIDGIRFVIRELGSVRQWDYVCMLVLGRAGKY